MTNAGPQSETGESRGWRGDVPISGLQRGGAGKHLDAWSAVSAGPGTRRGQARMVGGPTRNTLTRHASRSTRATRRDAKAMPGPRRRKEAPVDRRPVSGAAAFRTANIRARSLISGHAAAVHRNLVAIEPAARVGRRRAGTSAGAGAGRRALGHDSVETPTGDRRRSEEWNKASERAGSGRGLCLSGSDAHR